MSPHPLLHVFLFLFILRCKISSAADTIFDDKPTAYEVLESYNFPVGLLPKGVLGYDLDAATGDFSAYLNHTCTFSLEGSYELRYQPTISGRIAAGRFDKLHGVSVKVLFIWVDIIEVIGRGDQLQFSVGVTSADFDVGKFYESPQCGCGFDCLEADNNGGAGAKGSFLDYFRRRSSAGLRQCM